MSANEGKSREDVLAAREAKKLAKQKGCKKDVPAGNSGTEKPVSNESNHDAKTEKSPSKGKDEVDRVVPVNIKTDNVEKSADAIKAERAAKKAAKQAKKKKEGDSGDVNKESEMTVKDVVETLKDIVNVAKEVQDVTAKVQAINLEPKKGVESSTKETKPEEGKNKPQTEEGGKSKAELRAERRAKQEAQRAAKQAAVQKAPVEEKKSKDVEPSKTKEERPVKAKSVEKSKPKSQNATRVNWFQHLHMQKDKEALNKIPVNSANLHPAIVKLGVQMATKVVSGSNARCIALLDALKKMVRDYTLPAKTEFARGLEAQLGPSLDYLWSMRQPTASQTNAVKYFRHHLNQLPNNVDEFDAKKTLSEEIDRYIREQIDMAGKAISLTVRKKICDGDNVLTYGSSSLIERILTEAWAAGVRFRAVVVGARVAGAGGMLQRLAAAGLPTTYADITALSYVMNTVDKVVVGASALLGNGGVVGAAGTAQVALAARARNVPLLVAAETHKFTERVHTDAFVYNEIGDPDDLVDKTDENSPLKDWRSNPNLTPLNLTYDVTPPSLVTAVVTELAILPCTSAPVVLRFKLSEYGIQG